MARLQYLKDVVTLDLETEKCIGCGRCAEVCPHGVFVIEDKKARIVGRDFCMECGACRNNCPAGAITTGKGVGCAQAVINGFLLGTEPTCDCSSKGCS